MSRSGESRAIPIQIASIPYTSFTASQTYVGRYARSLTRFAQARTILVVNNLNQPASGNVNLVNYDSLFPKPTYAYTGSQSIGAIGSSAVGVFVGSPVGTGAGTAPLPNTGMDSLEIQFPMGVTAPTTGTVDIWAIEMI